MGDVNVGVEFKLEGMDNIIQKLNDLTKTEANKAIRTGLRAGCKVIGEDARRRAPVGDTGNLKKSIKVRAGKRKKNLIRMVVTTSKSDNLFTGKTFYGAFQEFGYKRGKKPIPGKHFMAQAFDSKVKQAEEEIAKVVKSELGL